MSSTKAYHNQGWFGKHPEIYDKSDVFMKYLRGAAAQKLGIPPPQKILDIATGTGAQGFEFSKLGHQVVGLDLDLNMLRQAQKKSGRNLFFLHADAEHIPLRSNFFDLAVISFAMHDVPFQIGVSILEEAKRVIKDEGMIYIIDHGNHEQSLAARVLYRVSLLFESPNYKPFVQRSFEDYLQAAMLKTLQTDFLCWGAIRLLILGKL